MKKKQQLSHSAVEIVGQEDSATVSALKKAHAQIAEVVSVFRDETINWANRGRLNKFLIGKILEEAKLALGENGHGQFQKWIKRNTALPERVAKDALAYYRRVLEIPNCLNLGFLNIEELKGLKNPPLLPSTEIVNHAKPKALESKDYELTREEGWSHINIASDKKEKIHGKKQLENKEEPPAPIIPEHASWLMDLESAIDRGPENYVKFHAKDQKSILAKVQMFARALSGAIVTDLRRKS